MKAFFELHRDINNSINCFQSTNNNCNPHFHSNIEILYVLDGQIDVTVNGRSERLTAGCASAAGSFDIHAYSTPAHSECIILIIPTDMVNSFNIMTRASTFASSFMQPGKRNRDMANAMERLVEFSGCRDSLIAKGYIYVILGILAEQVGISNTDRSGSDFIIRDILVYLEQYYLENLTIESLAKRYGYHKDYLSRLFNASIGCGFSHYVNILRARHAAMLLRSTHLSLEEIAYQSGFNSARTFYRAFQGFYGMTPTAYRRMQIPENDADRELIRAGNL